MDKEFAIVIVVLTWIVWLLSVVSFVLAGLGYVNYAWPLWLALAAIYLKLPFQRPM